jgi:GntR family transcriptional regulator/MocR family aminotransferase
MPNAAVHPLWGSLALDRAARESLQDQIVGHFRDAILSGQIPAGRRVPSSRQLSNELGVSRTTAIEAYDRLTAEGYLHSKNRAGLFVCELLPEDFLHGGPAPPKRPNFNQDDDAQLALPFDPRRHRMPLAPGMPAVDQFPWKHWTRLSLQVLRERPIDALYYGDPRGEYALRSAIAEYIGEARGIICAPDEVIIVSSSKHGVDIATRLLASTGDKILLEEPGHPLNHQMAKSSGLVPVPIMLDDKGLDIAEARRQAPDARLAVVSPSHQYALGTTMNLDRRLELLQWAERSDGWIIEDDHDGEYRYSGPPLAPLFTLDRSERVIYIGSFSNLLAPGLRMGYIVAPPSLARSFLLMGASMVSILEQMVVARFIEGGKLAAHLRRMRGLHSNRRELLIDALARHASDILEVGTAPEAGMRLTVHLPDRDDDRAIAQRAVDAGVFVHPLSIYYSGPSRKSGLVLGFASTAEEDIEPAVKILASIIRSAD